MHVHKGLKGHTVWFEDHTVWFGTIFLIVCAMIASHHNCPNSKDKIVYEKAKEYVPHTIQGAIWPAYYWNDSKKQCFYDDLNDWNSRWICSSVSTSISGTHNNTLVVICKGLESKGKTGTVLFSTHRDDNINAFYLKKLVDHSSVLNHWTKETRYYFWTSEADCMVSGPSKRASRLKTYQ
jgi:hypothetical protein